MVRVLAGISFIALMSGAAFGQSAEAAPKFELADVHPSARTTNQNPFMSGGVLRGGRYDLRRASMVQLISTAYGVDADKVLGGPNWLELDRFDVVARAPANTSPETIKLMLQALLSDRFNLVVRKDNRALPAFVLTVGKGKPKLKEAEGSGATGCQAVPEKTEPGVLPHFGILQCHQETMEAFARVLSGMGLTAPVVDSTGLKGSWDLDLKFTPRVLLATAGADGITIEDALDKQLGLKLEPQKVSTPVIVVDSVNEKPSPNAPGVITSLPPAPPAEFEVADIKPSAPDAQQMGRIQPGGRLDLQGFTLKMLINIAWDINDDEMLAGGPKFLDSTRFNVIAKTSSATSGQANAPNIDIDDLRLMLRALLTERFKLATHMEDRPVSAYTLTAGKPKLKPADTSNRTGWKEGPAAASKDPRDTTPILSRLVTCQNMTMAQFAEQLPRIASGYIHSAVQDDTGIEGAFDFTLSFSPAGIIQAAGRGGPGRGGDAPPASGATPSASDPSGALSLFDAVSKQLGLKLEMHKRPLPVLVIDHVEEKPTRTDGKKTGYHLWSVDWGDVDGRRTFMSLRAARTSCQPVF